jgi:hypothetical protein
MHADRLIGMTPGEIGIDRFGAGDDAASQPARSN